MKMKSVRKWSRILHRDIGFFFVGLSLIYGISGIALNHMADWNPNYIVKRIKIQTDLQFSKNTDTKEKILHLLKKYQLDKEYKSYNFVEQGKVLRIYLQGRSSVTIDIPSQNVLIEEVKKRPLFYEVNYLHYNPNRWWTWFSDIFAAALILWAITALFMVKGKKGVWGRGGIYIILGIVIPIVFLLIF